MVYGYIRISSDSQKQNNSFEMQESAILKRFPKAKIIKEQHSATTERPVFTELIGKLKRKDKLVCTEIDRLTRNTMEGIALYDLMIKKDFTIHIISVGEIHKNAYGRFSFINSVLLAEYEHSRILERTCGGREIARQNEKYREGRPKKFSEEEIDTALKLLSTHSYKVVEYMTGISKSTLIRAKRKEKSKQNGLFNEKEAQEKIKKQITFVDKKEEHSNSKQQVTFIDKKTFYLNYERLLYALTLLKVYDIQTVSQKNNIDVELLKNIKSLFDKEKDFSILVDGPSGKKSLPMGRLTQYGSGEIFEAMIMLKNYSYNEVERITGISKSTLIRAKRKINNEINKFMTEQTIIG